MPVVGCRNHFDWISVQQVFFVLLLIFDVKWVNIVLKVEESGGEWREVVYKSMTLRKREARDRRFAEGRCLCYVHGRIQSHSRFKRQTDSPIQIQRTVRR